MGRAARALMWAVSALALVWTVLALWIRSSPAPGRAAAVLPANSSLERLLAVVTWVVMLALDAFFYLVLRALKGWEQRLHGGRAGQ